MNLLRVSPLPGLQNLTYTRLSWPLSSEGSLVCHTYCDTGHPLRMVFSEESDTPSLWSALQSSCHCTFKRLWSVAAGNRTPISGMQGEQSTTEPPRRFFPLVKIRRKKMNHKLKNFSVSTSFHIFKKIFDFILFLRIIDSQPFLIKRTKTFLGKGS